MTDRSAVNRSRAGRAKGPPVGEPSKASRGSDAGALVCVVDDDEWVRNSFRILLESMGFTVKTYSSGKDILGDERRHQAHCFIIDQHMPEMDGLATLGALRREDLGAQTILMTGRLDARIAAQATALGIGAVLEKPFSATQLLEFIHAPREPTR